MDVRFGRPAKRPRARSFVSSLLSRCVRPPKRPPRPGGSSRTRRKYSSSDRPRPPPASAPAPGGGPLARYAEAWADDAGLDELDLPFEGDARPATAPAPRTAMTMDPATRRWTGNEAEFAALYADLDGPRERGSRPPDRAPFAAGAALRDQWAADARAHNALFGRGSVRLPPAPPPAVVAAAGRRG